jgi:hypothetical protein
MRGSIHTFRNVDATTGKMFIHIVPGGSENYLEEISNCSMPEGLPEVLEISKRYGITFLNTMATPLGPPKSISLGAARTTVVLTRITRSYSRRAARRVYLR